jgi:hypothetical protein
LFAVGRTDEAQAVFETLRQLPAAGDKDTRTLGALTQMVDLIVAFQDSEMAQATYDLFLPIPRKSSRHPHGTTTACRGQRRH